MGIANDMMEAVHEAQENEMQNEIVDSASTESGVGAKTADGGDKICSNCIFCRHDDYGYSNWTTEGSKASCLFGKTDFDDLVETEVEAANKIAAECEFFKEGSGIYIDVEQERMDSEIKSWIEQYIKR